MILTGGNRRICAGSKTCPSITLSTTHLTRIGLESKPVLCGTGRWRTVWIMGTAWCSACL